jgi:hypothetical protein
MAKQTTPHTQTRQNLDPRQRKVVSERPDAQAGVDQIGHKVA